MMTKVIGVVSGLALGIALALWSTWWTYPLWDILRMWFPFLPPLSFSGFFALRMILGLMRQDLRLTEPKETVVKWWRLPVWVLSFPVGYYLIKWLLGV